MSALSPLTGKVSKSIAAILVAATIGTAAMTAPAAAGGSFTMSVTPNDPEHAQALGLGLQLFSLFNGLSNGSITQNGSNNSGGLQQNGSGNLGIVHQDGNGHNGTLQQNGNGNTFGLFQFGEGTNGNVVQNGNGQSGAAFQFGW